MLPALFDAIQQISGKLFTLVAAANDSPNLLRISLSCKRPSPDTTACILMPGWPLLFHMTLLQKFSKGSFLFHAPMLSGMRHNLPGVQWPVYMFTVAKPCEQLEPITTGTAHHALRGA